MHWPLYPAAQTLGEAKNRFTGGRVDAVPDVAVVAVELVPPDRELQPKGEGAPRRAEAGDFQRGRRAEAGRNVRLRSRIQPRNTISNMEGNTNEARGSKRHGVINR